MHSTPKLPLLTCVSGGHIPHAVQHRLSYLWEASHTSLANSLPLSHALSRSFMSLANSQLVDIPPFVKTHICLHCSVLLYPTITSTVRLKKNSRESRFSRKARQHIGECNKTIVSESRGKSVKNILVTTCKVCDHVTSTPAYDRKPLKSKVPLTESSSSSSSTSSSSIKSFSFLDTVNRRHSAPSRLMSLDCIPLSSSPEKRSMNLLELERLKKKSKRRKTMGANEAVAVDMEDSKKAKVVKSEPPLQLHTHTLSTLQKTFVQPRR